MFQKVENSGIISLTSMVEIASVKVTGGFTKNESLPHCNRIFRGKKNPAEAGFFKQSLYRQAYGVVQVNWLFAPETQRRPRLWS